MIWISKNVYIDKIDDIVNKYNKTYDITIKIKPVDVKPVVKKDVYNAKIKNIEDKIPDVTNLATNTTRNAKWN